MALWNKKSQKAASGTEDSPAKKRIQAGRSLGRVQRAVRSKNIDFLQEYYAGNKVSAAEKRGFLLLLVPVLLAVVLAGITIVVKAKAKTVTAEVSRMESYVNDPDLQAKIDQASVLRMQISSLQRQMNTIQSVGGYYAQYPKPTRELFDVVALAAASCGGTVSLEQWWYDRENYTFTISCLGTTENSGADMMAALRKQEYFTNLSYAGFSIQQGGYYGFSIICTIKAVTDNAQ